MKIPLSRYWDLLGGYFTLQHGRFRLLVLLLLTSIGLQVANPQIVRHFIDIAIGGGAMGSLTVAALAFIGIALSQQVIGVSATYLGENVAWTATNALRSELARHCLNLDMSFHNNTSPGELIERIDGDVAELSNFFSQLVVRVIGNLILLLGILAVLFLEDPRVGLLFVLFAASTLFALNQVRGLAIPHQKAMRQAMAELFGYLEERLAGTEDIRASGAVDFVINGLYRLQYTILGHWRKAWRMFIAVRFTGGMMLTLGTVMALLAGYRLYLDGAITIGTAYLLIHYTNMLARPIRELTQQTESLQAIGASVERLSDLRAVERKIHDGPGAEIPAGPLSLTFEDVSFGYLEDERVLHAISFHLEPGRVLGLLGRTGSGKTTLARLVFRLYDLTQGAIRLDGVGIHQARLRDLRQQVAMVTQDVQLFQASIRDNLTFFDPSISDEQIQAVIAELELSEWYRSLPDGLDTRLETGGRSLSAGEAQLLAFTRVFLRDPGLVILDEASSRLDPATEALIERAVDKLLQNRTAVVIAHRLGTVHRADEIMILDAGQIAEHGAREQLAADPASRFFGLLQTGLEEVLA
jgi:ATP-binding cassette, subfamily B, bacterial